MAYQSFPENQLGSGIDQLSPESKIGQGYSEDLLNVDPTPEGSLAKRPGYEQWGGWIPLRVSRLEYSTALTSNLCFYLDAEGDTQSSINLTELRSQPILIMGRTSEAHASGDLTNVNATLWYPGFTTDERRLFLAGSNTDSGIAAFATPYTLVFTTASTSEVDRSNSQFLLDSYEVSKSSGNITISYTNVSEFSGWLIPISKEPLAGSVFWGSDSGALTTYSAPLGTSTFTIPAATHQLGNLNLLIEAFEDTGTAYKWLEVDNITVKPNGDIDVTLTNDTGSPFDLIISASTSSKTVTGTVAGLSSTSITIPEQLTSFAFSTVYLEDIITGFKEKVYPDSVVYDGTSTTVHFTNNGPSAANFVVHWEWVDAVSNRLCVDATPIASSYADTNPQLTIWGLDHRLLYNDSYTRPGWVNHLDTYRSEGEEKLIAGLGGNLFELEETTQATLFPRLRHRVSASTVTAPLFSEATSSRSRGYLKFSGAAFGQGRVSSISWNSSTGWVDYVISAPSLSVEGTLASMWTVDTDEVTITKAGYSKHNGVFPIKALSTGASTITISVENPLVADSDWDETDSGALAGVFTDVLPLNSTSEFAPGDELRSSSFGEEVGYTTLTSFGSSVYMRGVTEEFNWPAGLRVTGARTSYIIPTRDSLGDASVEGVVPGDTIYLNGDNYYVTYMNSNSDEAVTVVAGLLTLTSSDSFYVGQRVLLVQGGALDGEHTITDIPSTTEIQLDTELSGSAVLLGNTIQLEDSLSWEDPVVGDLPISVPRRWKPLEHPDDSFDLTPFNVGRYFDADLFSEQSFLRSVEVADNLYLTNGKDVPFKYDGVNIYRAGLPRWQPQLFASVDTTPPFGGEIVLNQPTASVVSTLDNSFRVAIGEELRFQVGDTIRHTYTGGYDDYVVIKLWDAGGQGYVQVAADQPFGSGGAETITKVAVYSYYMRLNMVDRNGNIISSATTGVGDTVVSLASSAQVRLRLIGVPAFDIYDYSRIEAEIFRTKATGVGPYYKLATLPLSFDTKEGYFTYIDTDTDNVLLDIDGVAAQLTGGTGAGTTWRGPLRSSYITTLGNSLIQANFSDFAQLDVRFVDSLGRITISTLGTTRWLLRRDNEDTLTTTDNISRVAWQFVNSFSGDITAVTTTAADFTATTSGAHGLSIGDWVYLSRASVVDGALLDHSGWWQVAAVPSGTEFTVNVVTSNNWSASLSANKWVKASDSRDLPVFLGVDGNFAQRNGNRDDAVFSYEGVAVRRVAAALSAHQRVVDITITGQENFVPWLLANAGAEFSFGQLLLRNPTDATTFLELVVPSYSGYSLFVNSRKVTSGQVQAESQVFPSRVLVSFPNYPEIFDSPTTTQDTDSLSAIDINPADGQEITGIIPFFGDSTFSSALKDTILVVFKTNSIYLVNLAAKKAGQNPVQKIESYGLGCTAPFSIAPTRDGIMFANESGIFKLNKSMQVVYIGRWIQRLWRERVSKEDLSFAQGHFWAGAGKYKLSCRLGDSLGRNEDVFVYDTTREYTPDGYRDGSWTRYDNHSAAGWCNLRNEEFWASTDGRVFHTRSITDARPWRDDVAPVSAEMTLRALDFGDMSVRKQTSNVVLQWRVLDEEADVVVEAATNLTENFRELDASKVRDSQKVISGLSEEAPTKLKTLSFSLVEPRFEYLQLRVSNSVIDSPMELSGAVWRVKGLSTSGITEAKETQ